MTVRIGELQTVLRCRRGDDEDELELELEGVGEAVLLACWGGVPLECASTTWEARACALDKLPVRQAKRDCNLRAALALAESTDMA